MVEWDMYGMAMQQQLFSKQGVAVDMFACCDAAAKRLLHGKEHAPNMGCVMSAKGECGAAWY